MDKQKLILLNTDELKELVRNAVSQSFADLNIQNVNSNKSDTEDLLSIEEAAEFLKLKVPTLYALSSKRQIPVCKKNKRLYFSRVELLEWVRSGKRNTLTEMGKLD